MDDRMVQECLYLEIRKVGLAALDRTRAEDSLEGKYVELVTKSGANMVTDLLFQGVEDIESLAAIAHYGWARGYFEFQNNYLVIEIVDCSPKWARRNKLASTPYKDLPEDEKDKDRAFVIAALKWWKEKY